MSVLCIHKFYGYSRCFAPAAASTTTESNVFGAARALINQRADKKHTPLICNDLTLSLLLLPSSQTIIRHRERGTGFSQYSLFGLTDSSHLSQKNLPTKMYSKIQRIQMHWIWNCVQPPNHQLYYMIFPEKVTFHLISMLYIWLHVNCSCTYELWTTRKSRSACINECSEFRVWHLRKKKKTKTYRRTTVFTWIYLRIMRCMEPSRNG